MSRLCLIPDAVVWQQHYVRSRSGLLFLRAGVYATWNGEDRFVIIIARQ